MSDALAPFAQLVVKHGVRPGLLDEAERRLALGLVWAGLPDAQVMTEAQVNTAIKALLAGPAAFLDVDHVELRRWLVDAAWLSRDGFGHAYFRVAELALSPLQAAAVAPLLGLDVAEWAAALVQARQAERERRRLAWAATRPGAG
jgi:hypothetical protein